MSQENVEVVRCIYAALDRGDDEAFWKLVAPDFVVDFSRRLLDPVVLCGRGQVQPWADRELEMWEGGRTRWQPEEVIDAGDKVLAFIRTGGRGKANGAEVDAYVWNVVTFRDDEPVEWTYFGEDRAAALEAAGLSEQDAHADS